MGPLIALNDGSHGVDPTNAMFSPCRKAFFTSSLYRDHFFDAAIASKVLIFTTGLKLRFPPNLSNILEQSLEKDERDERKNGLPQACCLELDHGLSLERENWVGG